MESTSRPPVRLHATSSQPLTEQAALDTVRKFLRGSSSHGVLAKGPDTTVVSQLEKFCKALEERMNE